MAPPQIPTKKRSAPVNIRTSFVSSIRWLFQHPDASGQFLIIKSPSPSAIVILIGHAPETNSLHHEKFNEERRRVIFVNGEGGLKFLSQPILGTKILAGFKSGFALELHAMTFKIVTHIFAESFVFILFEPGNNNYFTLISIAISVKTAANQSMSPRRLRECFSEGEPQSGQ